MRMKFFAIFVVALLSSTAAQAKIVTQIIPYKDGDTALLGYYAYDDTVKPPMPGVVVVHEWWGQNDYARKRAEDLAKLGYAAFAIDMFGANVKAETPDEAGALTKPFYDDRNAMRSRAQAGIDALKKQPQVNIDHLAAIGYCFGGTVALELARGGEDLDGVVAFHAGLATPDPAKLSVVKAEVLALNGADDPMSPPSDRTGFTDEMTRAAVKFESIDYPGATHAFTNPAATEIGKKFKLPVAYNAEADKKSFNKMKDFLKRVVAE
jgi:dienelactone hydrolase